MNGLDEEQTSPQTFLYGCMLEAGKEVVFNPEDDEFEHQLDLRMISVDPSTKDELHTVEVEGQDAEGQKVKAVLASLKPSTLPSVCLGGFWIAPPTVFRLKAGPGPVHISGQHLVMMDADQSFDEEDDECEEEEEEEEEDVTTSKKRPASSPAIKSQKKIKMDIEEDDDDDDDDEDGDEEEDDDDDDDDEEEDDEEDDDEEEDIKEEKTPVKAKPAPSKQQTPAQNGKSSKPGTPAPKPDKTPKGKGAKAKTSPSPKGNVTLPEVKAKLMEAVKKGVSLPKAQPKFENLLKQSYKVSDAKDIAELWTWRQSMKEAK